MIKHIFRIIFLTTLVLVGHTADLPVQIAPDDINAIQQHYDRYLTIAEQNKKTGQNVHQFNAQMRMRQVIIDLKKFDNTYIHSKANSNLEILIDSIYSSFEFEIMTDNEQQSVRNNINMLKNHIARNPVETNETGTNVSELLSRIWCLSNFDAERRSDNIFPTSSAAITFLLNVLRENSETGGGCYEGFAGRLGALYLTLINSWIVK